MPNKSGDASRGRNPPRQATRSSRARWFAACVVAAFLVGNHMDARQQRLAAELERVSIDAEALSHRMSNLFDLRPQVRRHAKKVADAAYVICQAAVAVHGGSTPELRDAFGRYLGITALEHATVGFEDDEGAID